MVSVGVFITMLVAVTAVYAANSRNLFDLRFCGQGSMESQAEFHILNGYVKDQWPEKLTCTAYTSSYVNYRVRDQGNGYDVNIILKSVKGKERGCTKCSSSAIIFNVAGLENYEYIKFSPDSGKCFQQGSVQNGVSTDNNEPGHGESPNYCMIDPESWTTLTLKVRKDSAYLFVGDKFLAGFSTVLSTQLKGGVQAKNDVVFFKGYRLASMWQVRYANWTQTDGCGPGTKWISDNQLIIETARPNITSTARPNITSTEDQQRTMKQLCLVRNSAWNYFLMRDDWPFRYRLTFPYTISTYPSEPTVVGIMYNIQDMQNFDFVLLECPGRCPGYRGGYYKDGLEVTSSNGTYFTDEGLYNGSNQVYARHPTRFGIVVYTDTNATLALFYPSLTGGSYFNQTGPLLPHYPANGNAGFMVQTYGTRPSMVLAERPLGYRWP